MGFVSDVVRLVIWLETAKTLKIDHSHAAVGMKIEKLMGTVSSVAKQAI